MRLLLLLLLLPAPLLAAEPVDLQGAWLFDEASGGREVRAAAIDELTKEFTPLFRGIVRGRLTKAVEIRERYTIDVQPLAITIASDENPAGWTTDLVGTPVQQTSSKGDAVTLTRTWTDGALHTKATAERGVTTFRFDAQGDVLTLHVSVDNDRLPRPLTYALTYRRE